MCRGRDEENKQSGLSQNEVSMEVGLGHHETMALVLCELCSSQASLYCQADDAYLCRRCDKQVHGANFLALRHIRCLLCDTCQNLTERYLIGTSLELVIPTITSWTERCNPKVTVKCSRMQKKWPFLFL